MTETPKDETKTVESNPKPIIPEDQAVVTEHSISVNGRQLDYTATTGIMVFKAEDEKLGLKPKAAFFYVYYQLKSDTPTAERPLTVSFNGGPGSASVWMHMGMTGPRRVEMQDYGWPTRPPFNLVDNEYTLLDSTDLLYIDPVSTGFSRPVPGEAEADFHSPEKDAESMGAFIALLVTRYERWGSPKFLIGESYGTTRAALLAEHLQDRYGMYLNGVVLVSTLLNFMTARFDPGNDWPYILFLPTYASSAWFHGLTAPEYKDDLARLQKDAEEFALGEYMLALAKGDRLTKAERQRVVNKLARLTGLSREYLLAADLRVKIHRFCKELLRKDRLTVGRFDTRITGQDYDQVDDIFERDPSYYVALGTFATQFNEYARVELGFKTDLPYEILKPLKGWAYDKQMNRYINAGESLRKALAQNPQMQVFVCAGYYDLSTPYFSTRYTFDHLGLPENQRKNVHWGFYEAGHMMYLHKPSLVKVMDDLHEFYAATLA